MTDAQHTPGEELRPSERCARSLRTLGWSPYPIKILKLHIAHSTGCDDLVDALEKLLNSSVYADAEGGIDVAHGGYDDEDHRAIVVEARAALAKAKRKTE